MSFCMAQWLLGSYNMCLLSCVLCYRFCQATLNMCQRKKKRSLHKNSFLMYVAILHPFCIHLLVGQQEGHPACKNWAVGCWHGYLSRARCRLAYGPADATATHSLASVKSRLVLPFWYRLTWVVPDKGLLNLCSVVCSESNRQVIQTQPHSGLCHCTEHACTCHAHSVACTNRRTTEKYNAYGPICCS